MPAPSLYCMFTDVPTLLTHPCQIELCDGRYFDMYVQLLPKKKALIHSPATSAIVIVW